jgi:hypothetical protein
VLSEKNISERVKKPGELRIAEILQTDGRTNERTDGRTDIKCLSNGRKNPITLKDQTKKMYQSSRVMHNGF